MLQYTYDDYDAFAEQLGTEFPELFSQGVVGIETGPGWWPIIKALCYRIQQHVNWKQTQLEKYDRGEGCTVTIVQIKEKFGGLRFYYDGGDDKVDGMVRMAESWAAVSCEQCGSFGTLREGGWLRTLCDEHELERR